MVWSSNGLTSSSGGGSSVTVPDEVDYVVVNGQKLTRGGNATVSGEVYNWAGNRHEIAYSTVTFQVIRFLYQSMVLTLAVFWLLHRLPLLLTKQKAAPGWGLLKRKVVFSIAIKEYSMSRDSTRQLSPSFKVREFACKAAMSSSSTTSW